MNTLRDVVRGHLVREARKRARDRAGRVVSASVLAKLLREAETEVTNWHVDHAIEHAEQRAALSELIVSKYSEGFPPALVKEIAESARWKREVAEMARQQKRGAA